MNAAERILPSPDCQTSMHAHCKELSWDATGREEVTCPCPCHEGTDPAEVEPAAEWMTVAELVRNYTIATNELRHSTDLRNRGQRTAAEHAHARDLAAQTRAAANERLGSTDGALFGAESAR